MPRARKGSEKAAKPSRRVNTAPEKVEKGELATGSKPQEKTISIEERIEESKYYTPQFAEQPVQKNEETFPHNYGDTRIVLLVRDPRWVHAYWEVTESKYQEARTMLGNDLNSSKEIIRVHNTSRDPWSSFDITVFPGARNWYINVPEPGGSYVVDIGYLAPDGRFILMARSNMVTTPREGMSDVIDEEWMTIDFDRIYALSGGFGIGKSSGEIRKLMEKRLMNQSASGWISSMSSPFGGVPQRPFFLIANTELIVYGATEPTAKLYVQGKKVNLRKDGTFTLRFALPDGKQVIPIEAVRDDEKEKRSITPTVERNTK